MLAMQYSIQLPTNYDTALIHQRVDARSKLFDKLPGLLHKSFLLDEPDKLYAPFYIWESVSQAQQFLLDDLFKGVIESFNRPRVRTWTVISQGHGNRKLTPTYGVREADIIAPEDHLDKLAQAEKTAQYDLLQHPDLYFHAVALDPERWELIRYSLWKDEASAQKPDADCIQTYEVLHVSEH